MADLLTLEEIEELRQRQGKCGCPQCRDERALIATAYAAYVPGSDPPKLWSDVAREAEEERDYSRRLARQYQERADTAEARLASAEQNTLDAYARIQALEGEVARLRDCLRNRPNTLLIAHEDGTTERLSRALADRDCRIAELEKALEPFEDVDGEGTDDYPDDHKATVKIGRHWYYGLTLGDFRRARAALSS